MPDAAAPLPPSARHSSFEDAQALLTGSFIIALGMVLFRQAGLLSGGVAGIAFLAHYTSRWPFGGLFFLFNLPFYFFAWRTLGVRFTLKTFVAVGLLAIYTEWMPHWIVIESIAPVFAAAMGGLLIGLGLLVLMRHQASLGGLGIMAVYLQEKHAWRAGYVQMVADCLVVGTAFFVVEWDRVLYSILGALMLNILLAINHRPGRYFG